MSSNFGGTELPSTVGPAVRAHVTLDDFMTGFIAGLAELGVSRVSIRSSSFYQAVVDAYDVFDHEASSHGMQPAFYLAMNPVHGDSADVRQGVTKAVQRDLVSLDNPVYLDMRLKVSRDEADSYLCSLPGEPDLYRLAARTFVESYPH